jgi:hypothetical protein
MKVDFGFATPYGMFRDSLHLPDDHGLAPEQITAMQTERLNSWIYAIENPPAPEREIIECNGGRYEKVEIDGQVFLKPVEA